MNPPRPTRWLLPRTLVGITLLAGAASLVPACSLYNRDGPEVTCADLMCGKINACEEGIIAQCLDGVTVRYHVCGTGSSDEVCEAEWQVPGQYRCSEASTDCEGCRPEREGCPAPVSGGGGGQGGGGD